MNLFILSIVSLASIFALKVGKQSSTATENKTVSGVPTTLPLDSSISSAGTVAAIPKTKKEKPLPKGSLPQGGGKAPHIHRMKNRL